jgi:hypothetical protein
MSASNNVMSTPLMLPSTPTSIPKKRSLVECLDDIRRLCEHEQQIMHNIGVSPNTKHMILSKIQEEMKKVITKAAYDGA